MTDLLAVDALGIAAVITAVGLLIPTVVAAIVTLRKVGELSVKVDDTHDRVAVMEPVLTDVNHAVNGKGSGEQTVSEEVSDLHDQIPIPEPELPHNGDGMYALVRHIADKVDRLEKHEREGT